MTIHLPDWFAGLSMYSAEDRFLRNRFIIRQAALIHNPEGSLETLANAIGIHYQSLVRVMGKHGQPLSPQLAIRIERAVGKSAIPRKLLRPDIFE